MAAAAEHALFDDGCPADDDGHVDDDVTADSAHHDLLLRNINRLDATRAGRSIVQRSEPGSEQSEFHIASGRTAPVNVRDLLASLGDKAKHSALRKEVNRASGHRPLATPLEKPQAARLQRAAGYKKVTEEVTRWENLVKQRRRAPHLSFPLEKPDVKVETAAEKTAAFVPATPLEREIAALLGASAAVVPAGALLSAAERRALAAVSLDEALERRRLLAKHRALLSYQEARNRRQNKIKSRKYHRVLKKERIKQHLKEFERLKICDPEAALAKLQQLERERVTERVSQRHANTGKWARLMALKRKYDPAAREALAENIRLSREKKEKRANADDQQPDADNNNSNDNSDASEEEDGSEEAQLLTAEEAHNPWMATEQRDAAAAYSGQCDQFWTRQEQAKRRLRAAERAEEEEERVVEEEERAERPAKTVKANDLDGESDDEEEEGLEQQDREVEQMEVERKKMAKGKKKGLKNRKTEGVLAKTKKKQKQLMNKSDADDQASKPKKKGKKSEAAGDEAIASKTKKKLNKKKQSKNIDEIFDKYEKKLAKTTEKKLQHIMERQAKKDKRKRTTSEDASAGPRPSGGGRAASPDGYPDPAAADAANIDERCAGAAAAAAVDADGSVLSVAAAADASDPPAAAPAASAPASARRAGKREADLPMLDPSKVLNMLTTQLDSTPAVEHDEDNRERRLTMAEAFADDDVVAEFKAEKAAAVGADAPKDIDMALPGWGDWGGEGLKVSARKRRRLLFRAPKGERRRDHTLGHVILSEQRNEPLRAHQPSQLPHHLPSVAAFEASIRTPLGSTWLPTRAHQQLTRPAVVTRAGTAIAPMDERQLLRAEDAGRRGRRRQL